MLGSGGGPSEGNVSGYLIRSTATSWAKNSLLAVDAGTHLAGIIRIFDEHQARSPPSPDIDPASPRRDGLSIADGSNHDRYEPRRRRPPLPHPFAGAGYPKKTARANAAWVTRELVSTYLITHPHLDHVSGFVVNTASFTHSDSPKRLAALPAAIKALKTHMFNDVIWPNLSDENGGAGLVTYQRIQEMAEYVPVCNGLSVQAWPVSHGHCMKRHSHRGRNSTAGLDGLDVAPGERSPGGTPRVCVYDSAVYFIRDDATAKEVMMWGDVEPDSLSLSPRNLPAWTEAARKFVDGNLGVIFIECSFDCHQPEASLFGHLAPQHLLDELQCLAEEAERIRHDADRRRDRLKRKRASNGYATDNAELAARRTNNPNPPEAVLAGGPRSDHHTWSSGMSCDNLSPHDDDLRSSELPPWRDGDASKPSPPPPMLSFSFEEVPPSPSDDCGGNGGDRGGGGGVSNCNGNGNGEDDYDLPPPAAADNARRKSNGSVGAPPHTPPEVEPPLKSLPPLPPPPPLGYTTAPLRGLHVVVTHVKDTLEDDVDVAENILASLRRLEKQRGFGCEFSLSTQGRSMYF